MSPALAAKGRHYLQRALAAADEMRDGLISLGLPVRAHRRLGDDTK